MLHQRRLAYLLRRTFQSFSVLVPFMMQDTNLSDSRVINRRTCRPPDTTSGNGRGVAFVSKFQCHHPWSPTGLMIPETLFKSGCTESVGKNVFHIGIILDT